MFVRLLTRPSPTPLLSLLRSSPTIPLNPFRPFSYTPSHRMPSYDDVEVITAYEKNLPTEAFTQDGAGLDATMPVPAEHTKLEHWDADGKPFLKEYEGNNKLKGKNALLTGADSGIGRSAAIMFAREGADISIAYLKEEQKDADEVKKEVESSPLSKGRKVNLIPCDLSIKGDSEVKRVVDAHVAAYGDRIDIVVNNAAQQILEMDLAKIDLANVESTFQINVVAMFGIVKHALPYMKRGASIINTTSVTAYKGSGGFMDYGSSKGAIVSFTRSLSVQLSPKGIRANAVAPGPIYTPLQPAARPADQLDGFGAGAVPLHGRAGQPAEVGPVYCWLASAEANYISGQVIHVNAAMLCPS